MKSPAFLVIRHSLCLLFAALSCTSLGTRHAIQNAAGSPEVADGSCAFFTRSEDIAHLWIFPKGDRPSLRIEIGLRPGSSGPREYGVYYHLGLGVEGEIPKWRRTDSVYAYVSWSDTLVIADSGALSLETNSLDRVTGRYNLSGSAGAHLFAPGRRVQFQGTFDATRDTAYERFVYRAASEFDKPAPRHRCAVAPPT